MNGVFAVQPQDVDAMRPLVDPFLAQIEQETSLIRAEDVLEKVRERHAQLWGYHDGEKLRGVVVTRVYTTTKGLLCNVWVCLGFDVDTAIDGTLAEIERWARAAGCYAIEIVGRKGWARRLSGYQQTAIVLEKNLTVAH